ncbi:(deoxy)nucleoside triphosphate pyrophosphohydrolase [Janibacter hoylei]|uniref:(deoxy)nucleoside triphosphate pyrophosphohydrolase n=1 Tax=Janibacter hoylei TaxID=364298 RepID=UPI0021A75BBD|nr:(deoxy)nucleoside triphosphate pyrophosphohydrolase [Janibacter hoylei]MCT1618627.1 (deoxy)nucleoside triphosphate pyrophosphohydrolase [Janibacter hoylei]MCT2291896.1 (deoxy)nucleoside triphosphate pyrophosphohydrolase [Janibacter hoylei]
MKKSIEVVGAVIVSGDHILCAQRGKGPLAGLWEFPGGKVESGETPEAALEREISEELGCSVLVGERITTTWHEYDFAVIVLTTFYCQLLIGEPRLTEHHEVKWVSPKDLSHLEWAPADVPAVQLIQATYV